MKPYSSSLERRLRKKVRIAVDSSPTLRRRYYRLRSSRPANTPAPLATILFLVSVGAACGIAITRSSIPNVLAGLAILSTGAAFLLAAGFLTQLYRSGSLVAYSLLPVRDDHIFDFQVRRVYSAGFVCACLLATIYGSTVGAAFSGVAPGLRAAAVGGLQGVVAFSLAIHLAAFVPRLPHRTIACLLGIAGVLVIFASPRPHDLKQVTLWGSPAGLITRLGWLGHDDSLWWLSALLVLAVVAVVPYSWLWLRGRYAIPEFRFEPALGHDVASSAVTGGAAESQSVDRAAVREALQSLRQEKHGGFDGLVAHLLTPRERLVLRFLSWDKPLLNSYGLHLGVVWFVSLVVVRFLGHLGFMCVLLPALVLGLFALPLFQPPWRSLNAFLSGNEYVPLYAVFPLSLVEMTRVLLLIGVVQLVLSAPLIAAFGIVAAMSSGSTPAAGVAFAAKSSGALAATLPLMVSGQLLGGAGRWIRTRWFAMGLLFSLLLILFGAVLFFSDGWRGIAGGLGGLAVLSWLFNLCHRRVYRKNRLDLTRPRLP
jgi:hypothetical protein